MGTTHRSGQCVRQSVDESHLVSGPGMNRCHIVRYHVPPPVSARKGEKTTKKKPNKGGKKKKKKKNSSVHAMCCTPLVPSSRFVIHLVAQQKERIVSPNPKPIVYVRGVPRLGIELKSSGALKRGVRIVNVMHKQQRLGTKYLEASNTCLFWK